MKQILITVLGLMLLIGCAAREQPADPTPSPRDHQQAAEHEHEHAAKHEHGHTGEHANEHAAEHEHSHDMQAMQARVAALGGYSEAMRHIVQLRDQIAEQIQSNRLAEVHPPAEELALTARRLPELADSSGIPRTQWRAINNQSRELANLFAEIDTAADTGKKAETEAAFAKMNEMIAALQDYDPQ